MPMNMTVTATALEGLLMIDPEAITDKRGFFLESYVKRRFEQHGLDIDFVQDNHSRSIRNVVRGLHFQDATAPQWRLVRCTFGRVWDVVVDLRSRSKTFGQWFGIELSQQSRQQLLIPPQFAHGFCVLSDHAEMQYKSSNYHTPDADRTLAWNDAEVAIPWPVSQPILSTRDSKRAASLRSFHENPVF